MGTLLPAYSYIDFFSACHSALSPPPHPPTPKLLHEIQNQRLEVSKLLFFLLNREPSDSSM